MSGFEVCYDCYVLVVVVIEQYYLCYVWVQVVLFGQDVGGVVVVVIVDEDDFIVVVQGVQCWVKVFE